MEFCVVCGEKEEQYFVVKDAGGIKPLCKTCLEIKHEHIMKGINLNNWKVSQRTRTQLEHLNQTKGIMPHLINENYVTLPEYEAMEEEDDNVDNYHSDVPEEDSSPSFTMQQQIDDLLYGLIGMDTIKQQLHEWAIFQEGQKRLAAAKGVTLTKPMMHLFLEGSPGTGKTILAKKIAQILHIGGFVSNENFVSVSAADLIGQHIGETAVKTTNRIEEAIGGVFFLDEAYKLATDGSYKNENGSGSYGREALETIMEALEKHRDTTVFIFAGYKEKMDALFTLNPGLQSRISHRLALRDYTPKELVLIGKQMIEEQGLIFEQAEEAFTKALLTKVNNGVLQGNARTIRTMMEKILMKHSVRIATDQEHDVRVILPIDIQASLQQDTTPAEQQKLHALYTDAMEELNQLVGLFEVKRTMTRIGKSQMVQQKRKAKGLKYNQKANHMFFVGSPGTGKTTVARIVGKIFRGIGMLSSGHFIEVTKDDLTGGFQQTSSRVKELIQRAKGGILFIDEAYALTNDRQGKEAIDTLIREMEEYREDLIVIFAGYQEDMERLINLNPGFASRVPYTIPFEDYNAKELLHIAKQHIENEEYRLTEEANAVLTENITISHKNGDTQSNGRWVRNITERLIATANERVFDQNLEDLESIELMDVLDVFCEIESNYTKERQFT